MIDGRRDAKRVRGWHITLKVCVKYMYGRITIDLLEKRSSAPLGLVIEPHGSRSRAAGDYRYQLEMAVEMRLKLATNDLHASLANQMAATPGSPNSRILFRQEAQRPCWKLVQLEDWLQRGQ
jgi:hypothetical protein